jgi:broad specificity phosphatase PhoE
MSRDTLLLELERSQNIKLIFMRHAEALSNRQHESEAVMPDESDALTSVGQSQAIKAGKWIAATFHDVIIVSSPTRRASETGHAISQITGRPIRIANALRERDFRFRAGTTVTESRQLQEIAFEEPSKRIAAGESVREHFIRVRKWWKAYEELLIPGSSHLVIGHGGTLDLLNRCILGCQPIGKTMASVRCDAGHFHLWRSFNTHRNRRVWRLEGINLSADIGVVA